MGIKKKKSIKFLFVHKWNSKSQKDLNLIKFSGKIPLNAFILIEEWDFSSNIGVTNKVWNFFSPKILSQISIKNLKFICQTPPQDNVKNYLSLIWTCAIKVENNPSLYK